MSRMEFTEEMRRIFDASSQSYADKVDSDFVEVLRLAYIAGAMQARELMLKELIRHESEGQQH